MKSATIASTSPAETSAIFLRQIFRISVSPTIGISVFTFRIRTLASSGSAWADQGSRK